MSRGELRNRLFSFAIILLFSLIFQALIVTTASIVPQQEEWVPYIPTADHVRLDYWKENGTSYMNVSIEFASSGFNVTDWGVPVINGSIISADAKIWMWTGYQYPWRITLSHTYTLGKLSTGEYVFIFNAWCSPVKNSTFRILIVVPDDYPTIQEAINAAYPEDTIYVKNGTYYENIIVNKTVTLIGENKEGTIIDGNLTERVVYIIADKVTIANFKIIHSKKEYAYAGIALNGVSLCNISSNIFTSNFDGIYAEYSTYNVIKNNVFQANDWNGIHLKYSSRFNNITFNIISNCRKGISVEVYSNNNYLIGNFIENNEWDGLDLMSSKNTTIKDNTIKNCFTGIYMGSTSNMNVIYHNNFINNTYQATCYSKPNIWTIGYPSGGNYWSDYTGVDEKSGPNQDQPGSDGIGDIPYVINENNTDRCPLIMPWLILYVDFWPRILQIQGNRRLSCILEFLSPFSVNDVNLSSIQIESPVVVYPENTSIGDYNSNGIPDIMIKFNPKKIISYVILQIMENSRNYKLFYGFAFTTKITLTGTVKGLKFEILSPISVNSNVNALPT